MNYRYELPIGISDVLVKISTIEKNNFYEQLNGFEFAL